MPMSTELLVKAERSRRFGLLACLAFGRFATLYRKYDADQPRDERGRWTETGVGTDVDVTGSVKVIRNDVRTGDREIDSTTDKLVQKLADVVDKVGEGSGAIYGIQVHSAFAEAVRTSGIPNLEAETTWFDGAALLTYGAAGSIRTDVVLRGYDDAGPVRAIWDVKTGDATLGSSRPDQIRTQVGVGRDVPVIELNVRRGVMIKASDVALLEVFNAEA